MTALPTLSDEVRWSAYFRNLLLIFEQVFALLGVSGAREVVAPSGLDPVSLQTFFRSGAVTSTLDAAFVFESAAERAARNDAFVASGEVDADAALDAEDAAQRAAGAAPPAADVDSPVFEETQRSHLTYQETCADAWRTSRFHADLRAKVVRATNKGHVVPNIQNQCFGENHRALLRKATLCEAEVEACVRLLASMLRHLGDPAALKQFDASHTSPDWQMGSFCTMTLKKMLPKFTSVAWAPDVRVRAAELLHSLGTFYFPFGVLTPFAGEPDHAEPMAALAWLSSRSEADALQVLDVAEAAAVAQLASSPLWPSRSECHAWLHATFMRSQPALHAAATRLRGLDEAQLEAATADGERATWIDAGPGAGKTRVRPLVSCPGAPLCSCRSDAPPHDSYLLQVLTARAAYLMTSGGGLPAERVLALTFTVKAAGELRARLEADGLPVAPKGACVFTIDAFALATVWRVRARAGLPPLRFVPKTLAEWRAWCRPNNPQPPDSFEQRMTKAFISVAASYPSEMKHAAQAEASAPCASRQLLNDLQAACRRGALFSWSASLPGLADTLCPLVPLWQARGGARGAGAQLRLAQPEVMRRVLAAFSALARADCETAVCNLFDIQRLALCVVDRDAGGNDAPDWVRSPSDAFARARGRERQRLRGMHLLVDEMQDTDATQLRMIGAISRGRITVVGDSDQAIYGFRGADPNAVGANFFTLFPAAQRLQLNLNYRSTLPIVECCKTVIAANPGPRKELRCPPSAGGETAPPVQLVLCVDAAEQYRQAARIASAFASDGWPSVAILCATNDEVAAIQDELEAHGATLQSYERDGNGGGGGGGDGAEMSLGGAVAGGGRAARACVSVCTIHKAKGLEFDAVVLAGMGEPWGARLKMHTAHLRGNAPAVAAAGHEERRKVYVALSRAKARLVVLHSAGQQPCALVASLAKLETHGWVVSSET